MLVAGATGFLCVSWNSIFMAEVARPSPRNRIVEATSASGVTTFLGYLAGYSIFSGPVTWSGSYRTAFIAVAAQLVARAALQPVILIRRGRADPAT